MADSAAGATSDLPIGEAGKESIATGTGELFDAINWFFRRAFANVFCAFQTNRPGIVRRVLRLLQMLI